jgi:hypothetical protein
MPLSQNPIVEWPAEFHHLLRGIQIAIGSDGNRYGRIEALLHGFDCARIECTHNLNSSDADGLRASKLKHAVQGMNSDVRCQ